MHISYHGVNVSFTKIKGKTDVYIMVTDVYTSVTDFVLYNPHSVSRFGRDLEVYARAAFAFSLLCMKPE